MRILYVATKYDYGRREQGLSFEHCNFFDCLHQMGHDILYFDFMALMQEHGREWMNQRLKEVAHSEKADLMFAFLAEEELCRQTVREISDVGNTITFNWFADDTTRFENFTQHWAPCFHWVATTAQSALPKYARIGYANVIKSQWATNPFSYRKLDLPLKYEATFVGQPHSDRRLVIDALRRSGVDVKVWGQGWESGRLSQEEMIRVFNQSRINLNLTNWGSPAAAEPDDTTPDFVPQGVLRVGSALAGSGPSGEILKRAAKKGLSAARRVKRVLRGTASGGAGELRYTQQIKGRNFEVPGCGGFLLTGQAENLGDYYQDGRQIVCFNATAQMIKQVHYYLKHEDKRAAIALAGYERTIADHTYVHRFTELFQKIGLPTEPAAQILQGPVRRGRVEEIS